MIEQDNYSVLVDRTKKKEDLEKNELRAVEEAEVFSTNHALASQFPEWDLKPPANLIKRRSNRWA